MKRLMTVVALTTLLASPVLAQSQAMTAEDEAGPYASSIGSGFGDVIENGTLVGRDPDANIRLQLRRDANIKDGSGGE